MFFNSEKRKQKKLNKRFYEAVKQGHLNQVESLIEEGADPNSSGNEYMPPLALAIHQKKYDIVEFLLRKGADINEKGGLPLCALCSMEDETKALSFLKLASNEFDPNVWSGNKETPLHYACSKGHFHLSRKLIKAGADLNAEDAWQSTPIFNAAYEGNYELVTFLHKKGAELDLTRIDGSSLLMTAIASPTASPSLINYLLREGADVEHCNDYNERPLHIACKQEATDEFPDADAAQEMIIALLLMNGANPNPPADENRNRPIDYVKHDEFIVGQLLGQAQQLANYRFDMFAQLGKSALSRKRYRAALQFLQWATSYDDGDADSFYLMSVALFEVDEQDEGMEYLVKAAQLGSEDALEFMENMGLSLET